MSNVFHFIDVSQRAIGRMQADLPSAFHAAMLVVAAASISTRIVFAWLRGTLSGLESLVLVVALLVSEAVAITWVRDFHGLTYVLLLLLPFAIWAAAETMIRISLREGFRSTIEGDMRRYREALRRDPRNAAALEMLGDAHMKLGRPRLAIQQYRAAVAIDRGSYTTRYKLERAERMAQVR